jgi:hypothetical protein
MALVPCLAACGGGAVPETKITTSGAATAIASAVTTASTAATPAGTASQKAVGSTASQAVLPAIDPKSLTLTLEDVPSGFSITQAETGYNDNERAATTPETLAEFTQHGRQLGYTVRLERPSMGLGDMLSILSIENSASVYRNAEGSKQVFELRKTGSLSSTQQVSSPNLGDQTYARTLEYSQGNQTAVATVISTLKGQTINSVIVVTLKGAGSFDQVVELARKAASKEPKPLTAMPPIMPVRIASPSPSPAP